MYGIVYQNSAVKDFKSIDKAQHSFLTDSLFEFAKNFSHGYEQELMKMGRIKKMKGRYEELYRLRLRSYRVIYKKEENRLIILVLSIKSRENSYKK